MARTKKAPPRASQSQAEIPGTSALDQEREAAREVWGSVTVEEIFSSYMEDPKEWESLQSLIDALENTLIDRVAAFARAFGFVPKETVRATQGGTSGGSSKPRKQAAKAGKADAPPDTEKGRGEILKALRKGEPMGKAELANAVGWDVTNVLDAMKAEDLIVGEGKGRGTKYTIA